MPYYSEIDTLFIHIPKTGGTSLEDYLRARYTQSLWGFVPSLYKVNTCFRATLQHQLYRNIRSHQVLFGVDTEKCKIITIVRNPYERAVSDLFYLKRITKDSSKSAVYGELRSYIARCPDNHGVPQYLFLIDSTGKIPQTIKIFKTETLTDDLRAYGFSDFDVKSNQGPGLDYYSYLNRASIALINERYMEDFQFFGYELIKLETAPST